MFWCKKKEKHIIRIVDKKGRKKERFEYEIVLIKER